MLHKGQLANALRTPKGVSFGPEQDIMFDAEEGKSEQLQEILSCPWSFDPRIEMVSMNVYEF